MVKTSVTLTDRDMTPLGRSEVPSVVVEDYIYSLTDNHKLTVERHGFLWYVIYTWPDEPLVERIARAGTHQMAGLVSKFPGLNLKVYPGSEVTLTWQDRRIATFGFVRPS